MYYKHQGQFLMTLGNTLFPIAKPILMMIGVLEKYLSLVFCKKSIGCHVFIKAGVCGYFRASITVLLLHNYTTNNLTNDLEQ